jgi:lipoprotein-anchoring transpeptidase ErfK/SrfK
MTLPPRIAVRLLATLALSAGVAAVAVSPAALAGSAPTVPKTQSLVVLEGTASVFTSADPQSVALKSVTDHRPITGERTVLPVLGEATGTDGRTWIHVMLPGRPNGHTGWISPSLFRYASTPWRILVTLGNRHVRVYHSGKLVRTFTAVVGKASTPTPQGQFFVEETLELSGKKVGAPFAIALSARSRVLQQFDGGPGQIALHGLNNVGGVPGTAASHGCVRLSTANITWLADRIGPGVPVTISG